MIKDIERPNKVMSIAAKRCGNSSKNKGVKVNPAKGKVTFTEINQWETENCCRRIIENLMKLQPSL